MLRWGILGTGGAAADLYAPALRACGHDLAVVGSRALLRAQSFAANHGVRRARAAYEDVLGAPDVDAVLLALPTDLHEQWAVAALEAGKHVLCPRPLAMDGQAAGRMAAASARTGRVLAEASPALAHPRFAALVELLRAGSLGEVRLVHVAVGERLHDPRSFRAQVERGGGALLALGTDAVAVARRVAGTEPSGVRALQRRWSTGIDGTVAAILSFPTGTVATVTATFDAAAHDRLEIVGSEGAVTIPRPFGTAAGDDAPILRDGEPIGTWSADATVRVVEAFSVATRGVAGADALDDAVANAGIVDRIRLAAA